MTYGVFGSYGELFLKQGRPLFPLKGCAILCSTTYRVSNSGEELRNRIVTRSFPPPFAFRHAEELVFNEIKVIEEVYYSKAVRVELYSSYSPCDRCCGSIENFLSRRPGCKISIAFTCVYLEYEKQQRSALNRLRQNESVIRLDVFGERDWEVLQEMELVTLTPEQQEATLLLDKGGLAAAACAAGVIPPTAQNATRIAVDLKSEALQIAQLVCNIPNYVKPSIDAYTDRVTDRLEVITKEVEQCVRNPPSP